jgi:hypothetical protein
VAWCEKQPGRQGGLSGTVWTVGSMWVVRGSTVGGRGRQQHAWVLKEGIVWYAISSNAGAWRGVWQASLGAGRRHGVRWAARGALKGAWRRADSMGV